MGSVFSPAQHREWSNNLGLLNVEDIGLKVQAQNSQIKKKKKSIK